MTQVVIIDYGIGNIGSVANMIRRLGHDPVISRDPDVISDATHLILVGVGAFDSGISHLRRLDIAEPLQRAVKQRGAFLLGVCLGMQLLMDGSDEGSSTGLGFISGRCMRLSPTDHYKVPNMGWRELAIRREHPIFNGLENDSRFYFVHSYAAKCKNDSNLLATLRIDSSVAAAISDENVFGVQFHPEKSHRFGLTLYKNFCSL